MSDEIIHQFRPDARVVSLSGGSVIYDRNSGIFFRVTGFNPEALTCTDYSKIKQGSSELDFALQELESLTLNP